MSRTKTRKGEFRKKRGDTLVGNLEREYGINFGVRSDMKLSTYLKTTGLSSLGKAIDKANSRVKGV